MIRFTIPAMAWVSKKTRRRRMVIDAKYTEGKVPNWTRKSRYQEWKQHVQECAYLAGVEMPLRPTKTLPLYIVTIAYFHGGTHPDPSNVWEGITDALCYVSPDEQALGAKRGSDKYVGGIFFSPQYDKQNPRVEVNIITEQEFNGMALDHSIAVIERLIAEEEGGE